MNPAVYAVVRALVRTYFNLAYRMRVEGLDLVPATGGLILASNHASYLDPPIVGAAVGNRQVHFLARSTLFRNPWFGWLIRRLQAHPIRRGQGPRQDWDGYIRLLDSGVALLVFPEGTRTPHGRLQRGQSGFGKLVYMARKPVTPVHVAGSYAAFPKGGRHRFSPVLVRFGPVLDFSADWSRPESKRVYRDIAGKTMAAVARLAAPETASAGAQAEENPRED